MTNRKNLLRSLAPLMVLLLAIIGNSCKSVDPRDYPIPEFNKPFSFVLDGSSDYGYEDRIIMSNNSSDSNMSFNIYVHEPSTQEWVFYATTSLKSAGDSDRVSSKYGDIDDIRYFAIESLGKKNYKYQFYTGRNNLYINVMNGD